MICCDHIIKNSLQSQTESVKGLYSGKTLDYCLRPDACQFVYSKAFDNSHQYRLIVSFGLWLQDNCDNQPKSISQQKGKQFLEVLKTGFRD